MCSFCICKSYTHFSSKNTFELYIVLTRTVNILTTNKLVRLIILASIFLLASSRATTEELDKVTSVSHISHNGTSD